jgi:hypothetical protein
MTVNVCIPKTATEMPSMAALNVGLLPAAESNRPVGKVSAVLPRAVWWAVARIGPPRDVMAADVKYCFEDEDIGEGPATWPISKCGVAVLKKGTWSKSLRLAISQFASREVARPPRTRSSSAVHNMQMPSPAAYARVLDGSGAWNRQHGRLSAADHGNPVMDHENQALKKARLVKTFGTNRRVSRYEIQSK